MRRPSVRVASSLARAPGWVWMTLGVALVARVAYVVLQSELEVFAIGFDAGDSALYRSLADGIRAHGTFEQHGEPTAFVTPGYPLFLAALFEVSRSAVFIGLVQSVLGAVTAVLLADVARRLGGVRAAYATGAVAALYPHLVFWTGYVLTETLYIFLLALALAGLARAAEARARPAWTAGAGAVIGAAALVRPTALGFGVLLALAGLTRPGWRVPAVAGLAALAVVVAPWAIRNAITLGTPTPTSTESGVVLYQGNSPDATGGTRGYVDRADYVPLDIAPGTSEAEEDRLYRRAALDWMRNNPGRVLELAPKKLWNMWRPTYAHASATNRLVTYPSYLLLLGFGVGGLWIARRRGAVGAALVLFVAYHLVLHGLVTGLIRFRVPVEAMLAVTAGLAVAALLERGRGRSRRPAPGGAGASL